MSPSESLTLVLNDVSGSDSTPVCPDESPCKGCYLDPNCHHCVHTPDHVSNVEEDQEVPSCNAALPNISAAREVRAYEYTRRQVKKATKLAKTRQRKQVARPHAKLTGSSGLNRKARKEIGTAVVKRARDSSAVDFLLEDGSGVFEEEGSVYGESFDWKNWLECDSYPTRLELDSESEDGQVRIWPDYKGWTSPNMSYCSTCPPYDDGANDLVRSLVCGIARNDNSPSYEPTRNRNSTGNENLLPLPQLDIPLPNISAAREVRAYEYKRDQVKNKVKFTKFLERKQLGRIVKSDGPKPKGRKHGHLRVVNLDLDAPEDFEEEHAVPLEVSLSFIVSEEPSSRPFDMSDLVQTVKVKKEKEPGFEFVPQVREVIVLDDPARELDFEDSQWEHVWNDDLLDEQLLYVQAASF